MFFVFEGIDGTGKSTQAELLKSYFEGAGREVLLVREPGGTDLGEALRQLLFASGSEAMTAETELFLFMAARSHLVSRRLVPALQAGAVVVCDRFLWSSVVYQGIAGGMDLDDVFTMGRLATRALTAAGLEVTKTLLIDVDPATAHARATGRNRMEERGVDFQRVLQQGFQSLVRTQPHGELVDGGGAAAAVHARVLRALSLPRPA